MHQQLRAAALAAALAAAGCAAPASLSIPSSPAVSVPNAGAISPELACPAAGKVIVKGKSSAAVVRSNVLGGGTTRLTWTVVFKDQPAMKIPVTYTAVLFACGPPNGKKPIGKVADTGSGSTEYHCVNGVCKITQTYSVQYTAPRTWKGAKPWKYDLVRFDPTKRTPPYGVMPGILVQVHAL